MYKSKKKQNSYIRNFYKINKLKKKKIINIYIKRK